MLRDAADRLAPQNKFRKMLEALRVLIARARAAAAGASPDPKRRARADSFTASADKIALFQREAEEMRTRFTADIDRIERLRDRLEDAYAANEIDDFVKHARAYLDQMKAIADDTRHLANGLENFGSPPPTN